MDMINEKKRAFNKMLLSRVGSWSEEFWRGYLMRLSGKHPSGVCEGHIKSFNPICPLWMGCKGTEDDMCPYRKGYEAAEFLTSIKNR